MKSKPKLTQENLDMLLSALETIRTMGYQSVAPRATETVLACIRVSESVLAEVTREPDIYYDRYPNE